MKLRRALLGFLGVTLCYVAILGWLDSKNQVFLGIQNLWPTLASLSAASLVSYLVRYLRWHWLLSRSGYSIKPVIGFLSYLAGFAFTATPGKVGELVRIRYLLPLGVPASTTLAAFIYERAFDLLVVLTLSSLFVHSLNMLMFVAAFVISAVMVLLIGISKPKFLNPVLIYLRAMRANRLAKLIRSLRDGLLECQLWINPKDIFVSFSLGLIAWGLIALSFVWLCHVLGINISLSSGVAIYPISMLAGALSMIPGGLGSTEAIIVGILVSYGNDLSVATLVAVTIRFSTLWLSIACGMLSVMLLEVRT